MEVLQRLLNLLPFVIALAAIVWLYARARRRTSANHVVKLDPESKFTVDVSDTRVSVHRPDGTLETIDLDALERIVIRTNGLGPWQPDVWWELYSTGTLACTFPQGATGEQAMMDLGNRLPGFDFAQLIEAMGSTSDAEFLCWARPN
jgi:hypothetical protein